MKKRWWPPTLYAARPWAAAGAGLALAASTFLAVMQEGGTGVGAALLFLTGCGLVVYGVVVLQLRREYRQRSKWFREHG